MVQPLIRIYHHCFRRLELFRRIQFPVKAVGMDAQQHSCRIVGIHLNLRQEIAAVDQAKSNGFPLKLICRRTLQDHKWIVVVGRISSDTAHRLDPLLQPSRLWIPLSRPGAGELDHIIAAVRKIQTKAHGRLQMKRLFSLVYKTRAPCQDPACGKNGVKQFQLQSCHRIRQPDHQRLGLFFIFNIGCRKSGELGLPCLDPVFLETKLRDPASVFLKDFCGRHAIVRGAEHPVFLPDMLHRKPVVRIKHTGGHGT